MATFATLGAINISAAILNKVPKKEKNIPTPKPFAPSPFSIIG